MDKYIELDGIAGIAITLATLASIIAALRGGDLNDWAPRFRLGFWMLVQYSLGAVGFALLPSIIRDFGVTSWWVPVGLLAVFVVISVMQFLRRHLALERSGVPSRSTTIWFIGSLIMILTATALIWSLFGGLGEASYHLYHFGVMVCLLTSLGAFVGVLRLDPRPK